MSSLSRHPSTSLSRDRIYNTESYHKSDKKYYTPYEPLSSSPPPSSSPPMTPYSTRHTRNDALIRSSPEIGLDTLFHSVREHMDDPYSTWSRRHTIGYPERAFTPSKRDYFSSHSYPPPSDFDISEYSEDVDHDIPEVDSEHTSDSAPGRNSVFFSDTEEEENYGNNNEFSFGNGGYRTTFFRTSAERGQWKSHPIPFKSTPLPQARSSASIPSRLPTPVLVDSTRTNSEPAPSTVTGLGFSVESDQSDKSLGADDPLPVSSENVAESELRHEAESPHTMPSLTSDWESMPDIDGDGHRYERPSSPLPPSSPMSYSVSRSVSAASSPLMRSSSPLSEISSLDEEERHADKADAITQTKVGNDNNKKDSARRKRRRGNDHEDEHPILKKHEVDMKAANLLRPMTHNFVQNEKAAARAEKDEKITKRQVSIKPKRRRKLEVQVSISCPASSTKRTKPHRPLPKASSRSHLTNLDRNVDSDCPTPRRTQDPQTVALNAQLCGMLIETMALSRASSLPLSSLYKMVMQTQPSLRLQRSEQEWLTVFARVLQEGEAGHGSGVFGKVESSGKDDSNRPLEAQWFYVPEQDQDQERAALIRSMMPRPAKRTETKKYKQYYWRPLDKISKWDPEDEL